MRPLYNGRALRAIAALVAAVLALAAFTAAASTSTAASAATAPHAGLTAHAASAGSAPDAAIARSAAPAAGAGAAARAVSVPQTVPAPRSIPSAVTVMAGASRPAAEKRGARRRRHHVQHRPRPQVVMLHPDVLVGQDVAFIGHMGPGATPRLIGVQRRLGSRWVDVARVRTDAGGRFLARYWPRTLGSARLRLRLSGRVGRGATLAEPIATVFRQVVVSWYGPGGTTACGEVLAAGTLGVANRTLPCGTMVTLRNGGRTVRVPVIDRGPYVAGRDYDLTYATKLALGAGDVSVIWASA